MKVEDLKQDANNYRRHSKENKRKIKKSIDECGYGRSVVIDADGVLIAGNGVHSVTDKNTKVRVIETDGTELVVVKRTDLHEGDEKRKRLAAQDNATSDNVEWDFDNLLEDFDAPELEDIGIEVPTFDDDDEDEDEVIERNKREFAERMANGEDLIEDEEYNEFVAKFEAKKTTDDCYTPDVIYEAVADWVANEYGVSRANFVRPFYPNGDYQKEKYNSTDIVVDNPPFSILASILYWYNEHGIKYFLFCPSLTIFSSMRDRCTAICLDVSITYENGAIVKTSFITNLEDKELKIRSAPSLYDAVKKANDVNLKNIKKNLPKYSYPNNVITAAFVGYLSRYGQPFYVKNGECKKINCLDSQKEFKKAIFGNGYLVSDKVAADKAAAEKAAAEKAAAAEKVNTFIWKLSNREKDIIKILNEYDKDNE